MPKYTVFFDESGDQHIKVFAGFVAANDQWERFEKEWHGEKWIEMYEQSRLMTKAGQAQMAKQGAPSTRKVAAKRVDTKRRR